MKKLAPALILLTLFTACSKDEPVSMRTRMITNGSWRIADLRATMAAGGMTTDTSLYGLFPSYQRDDRFRFFTDGNVAKLEGATKPLPQFPDSSLYSRWAFSFADTKISFSDTLMAGTYDVQRLSDTEMVFVGTKTAENGTTSTTTYIYKR